MPYTDPEKRKVNAKAYYLANRDKRLAGHKKWREKNAEKAKAANKKWHEENREYHRAYRKSYYEKNRERCLARQKKYREENAESVKASSEAWRKKNRHKVNAWHFAAYHRDPAFRMRRILARRLHKLAKGQKSSRTLELLGCSLKDFVQHLERQFKPGMTWENYGPLWHVDHIKPCAKFDLADTAQQKECFHYTNLQPLWAIENLRKGAR